MTRVLQRSLCEPSPVAVKGDGLFLTLGDGRRIIDASGGAAVACLGHGDVRVVESIAKQAAAVSYAHTGFFTSEPAEALAELLLAGSPGGLLKAFFISSGSEAMEAALKLARQYYLEIGQPERVHVISRRQSYHGATLGALAVSGHFGRRAPYDPLFGRHCSQVSPCFPFHYQAADEDGDGYVRRLAGELEAEFQRVGPGRVMAFCAETVVGATAGCVTPSPGYFAAIGEVCARHGALLILDEIMCGMGRTGFTHAWEAEGVVPDIQAVGKGLGGGYQAIGGILVAKRVVDALARGSQGFMHGQTYQAHPVACAAALEVQRIIRKEGLVENCRAMGELLKAAITARLGNHPNIGDIRGRGLFLALEFLASPEDKRPFAAELQIAEQVKHACLAVGLGVYPGSGTIDGVNGDHVLVAPPFNVQAAQIEMIADRLADGVTAAFAPSTMLERRLG